MKLSEIFLEAARKIPKNRYTGMCEVLRKILYSNLESNDIRSDHQANQAARILYMFRPHEQTWMETYWFSKEAEYALYKVATNKEAQALRTDILIWCATIAEREGL